jgi:hypothetical protein
MGVDILKFSMREISHHFFGRLKLCMKNKIKSQFKFIEMLLNNGNKPASPQNEISPFIAVVKAIIC